MRSAAKRVEQFAYLTEHVCQRQHRYETLTRINGQDLHTYLDIVTNSPSVEHDAFRRTGRAAGIVDERKSVRICREMYILRLYTMRVLGLEGSLQLLCGRHLCLLVMIEYFPVFQRDSRFESGRHCLFLQFFPYIRTNEQHLGIRVIQQMSDVLCREILQDGDDDPFVGSYCKVSNCPVGAVTSCQGDLIAAFDTQLLEERM